MVSRPFENPFSRPWMTETGAANAASKWAGLKGVIAGGITGAIEISITYPSEFVKTQLQLDKKGGANKRYSGIIDCVKKTVKNNGITGLYRGMSGLVYGAIPRVAIMFGSFEQTKLHLMDEKGMLSPVGMLICGFISGTMTAIFALTPTETIKVKFIHDMRREKPRFKGFFHGVRTIIREEGFRGIYKGGTATWIKQSSNLVIRFFIMESTRDWYKGDDRKRPVPAYFTAACAASAGLISVALNNPIDVIKTRMQGLDAAKYKNTLDCITKTWNNEGPFAFYKGMIPRMCRVVFELGITFTVYHSIMDVLHYAGL